MVMHLVRWVGQLVAHVILIDDVGGLGVQLPNGFSVKPLPEALHLGKLAARLQHHQDAHQAQQQVDWESKNTQTHIKMAARGTKHLVQCD